MLSDAGSTVTVLLADRTALLYSHKSSKRLKSQEKATINGIPTRQPLFQIHTDSSFAMCCSLTHHFFIHILISKYLLRKTRSMVTSLNPICSPSAGDREEACDKASSKTKLGSSKCRYEGRPGGFVPRRSFLPSQLQRHVESAFTEENHSQLAAHCGQTPCCLTRKDANNSMVGLKAEP